MGFVRTTFSMLAAADCPAIAASSSGDISELAISRTARQGAAPPNSRGMNSMALTPSSRADTASSSSNAPNASIATAQQIARRRPILAPRLNCRRAASGAGEEPSGDASE
jgi:hypothetical protein